MRADQPNGQQPAEQAARQHHAESNQQQQNDTMGYQTVAQHFGDFIASCDYSGAWGLLTKEAQSTLTPQAIKIAATGMVAYASGPIQEVQVMEDFILEDWPDKQPTDLAVIYVALSGESFSEAVTLTLAQVGDETLIRHLEWGRP